MEYINLKGNFAIKSAALDVLAEAIKRSKLQYLATDDFDFQPGTTIIDCRGVVCASCYLGAFIITCV